MADIHIPCCPKCGGPPRPVFENEAYHIRCASCGYSVKICDDKDTTRDFCGNTVIPYDKGAAAVKLWNTEEVANG